jgi:hypothetical protein
VTFAAVLLVAGDLLLWIRADRLVEGSPGLARAFGIPPLVVGLTVVAWGTSMPELVVSGLAAWNGSGGIALGNVVGRGCQLDRAIQAPEQHAAGIARQLRVVERHDHRTGREIWKQDTLCFTITDAAASPFVTRALPTQRF